MMTDVGDVPMAPSHRTRTIQVKAEGHTEGLKDSLPGGTGCFDFLSPTSAVVCVVIFFS